MTRSLGLVVMLAACGGGGVVGAKRQPVVAALASASAPNATHAASASASAPTPTAPAAARLPLERIAIVGASVSAGLGGTPFGEAFAKAAPGAVVESYADVMLFQQVESGIREQLAAATAFHATVIVGLDLLFWPGYRDPFTRMNEMQAYRVHHLEPVDARGVSPDDTRLGRVLAMLEQARAAGAWIVIGDIPRITTAAPWMIAPGNVPSSTDLAADNATIAAWAAHRERVILVPFATWTAPLAQHGTIDIAPGERVAASDLVNLDGLHPNPLGDWFLLDRLDHFIETALPGTPTTALAFARP